MGEGDLDLAGFAYEWRDLSRAKVVNFELLKDIQYEENRMHNISFCIHSFQLTQGKKKQPCSLYYFLSKLQKIVHAHLPCNIFVWATWYLHQGTLWASSNDGKLSKPVMIFLAANTISVSI